MGVADKNHQAVAGRLQIALIGNNASYYSYTTMELQRKHSSFIITPPAKIWLLDGRSYRYCPLIALESAHQALMNNAKSGREWYEKGAKGNVDRAEL